MYEIMPDCYQLCQWISYIEKKCYDKWGFWIYQDEPVKLLIRGKERCLWNGRKGKMCFEQNLLFFWL